MRLADILDARRRRDSGDLHVVFCVRRQGDVARRCRHASARRSRSPKRSSPEVLIAFAMNGEPLTPEHGFPLRVVVPGYIGARSVKWLTAISIEDEPSDNYFQQNDYKLLPDRHARRRGGAGRRRDARRVAGQFGDARRRSTARSLKRATSWSAAMRSRAAVARSDASTSQPTAAPRGRRLSCDTHGAWTWTLWRARVDAFARRGRAGGSRVGLRRADAAGAAGNGVERQGLHEQRLAPNYSQRPVTLTHISAAAGTGDDWMIEVLVRA